MKTRVQRFTGANGVELAADVGGDPQAPPVILMHGGGQTRHSWRGAMLALITRGYYVVNLDARGHGDSQWAADGDYSFQTLAQDLEQVIVAMTKKPALVGASMGGATALTLVGNSEPDLASSLVLVDVVPRIDPAGAQRVRDFMRSHTGGFATLEEVAETVAAYTPNRPRPADLSGLMRNLRRCGDGRLYWHWDPKLLAGLDGLEAPLPIAALQNAAARVRIPTMLVRGLRSDVVTDEGVEDIRRSIPQIEVFNVAKAGHMVAGDENDVFNHGVFAFLQRHMPPLRCSTESR